MELGMANYFFEKRFGPFNAQDLLLRQVGSLTGQEKKRNIWCISSNNFIWSQAKGENLTSTSRYNCSKLASR